MRSVAAVRARSALGILGGALVFVLAVYSFRHGAVWVGAAFDQPVDFQPLNNGFTWKASLDSLPPGLYLASLGHYIRPCNLFIDQELKDWTNPKGIPYRFGSNLSAAIVIGEKAELNPKEITVSCERAYTADSVRKTPFNRTLILPYRIGLVVRLLRAMTDMLLGPLLGLLLVATFLMQFIAWNRPESAIAHSVHSRATDLKENWPFLTFAVAGLFHSLVSADVSYYLLNDQQAPYVYIFTRNFLCLSFLLIAAAYSRKRTWLYVLNVVSILVGYVVITWYPQIKSLLYGGQMYFYTFATAIAAYDVCRHPKPSESTRLVQSLVLGWLLLQLPTMVYWLTGWSSVLGIAAVQGMITVSITILTYLRYRELARQERIETSTARVLGAIESVKDLRALVSQISSIASREVHYRRASAYLDAFCVGAHDHPGEVFLRVMEHGYRKETAKDSRVAFSEGRGSVMREALATGRPLLRRGERDGAWFMVVPVGRHACINLSDDEAGNELRVHESRDVIERLLPALKVLESRLTDVAIRQGLALEGVRAQRGDGKWECEVGAVFADVNDYSLLTEHYGPAFADFISTQYFPGLVKAASRWAVPEFVRGDELYLVSLSEFLPESVAVSSASLEVVKEIMSYVRVEGARLCADHGFPEISLSIGANSGSALLICDPIKVRTAGRTVNDAKRLQEAASAGGALIHADAFEESALSDFSVGPRKLVLVKKNCIPARSLSVVSNQLKAS